MSIAVCLILVQVFRRRIRPSVLCFNNFAGFIIIGMTRSLRENHKGSIPIPIRGSNRHQISLFVNRTGLSVRMLDCIGCKQPVHGAFQGSIGIFLCVGVKIISFIIAHIAQIEIPLIDMNLTFRAVIEHGKGVVHNAVFQRVHAVSDGIYKGCGITYRMVYTSCAGTGIAFVFIRVIITSLKQTGCTLEDGLSGLFNV